MHRAIRILAADEPNAADWLSAWSDFATALITLGTLGAAIAAAIATYGTLKAQSTQLAEARVQEKRAQAGQFAVWLSGDMTVSFSNASNQPIYDVLIRFEHDGVSRKATRHLVSPDHLNGRLPAITDQLRVDLQVRREVLSKPTAESIEALNREWCQAGLSVEFTDAHGYRWRRDPKGRLAEVPEQRD
ncbi:hypothetical protein [Crossiella sp. CA198]|uniref:hypothetical protein n=1 Tax=Crossiella sp. CA198 TaxID=3455607 RepID=UPI003F8D0232